MEVITKIKEMMNLSSQARKMGKSIALVPTMGFFHEGHLSLMREGRKRADLLVVSLFVNPTQFAPTEDLKEYPRDFHRDRKLAEEVQVDVLFSPETEEMYPRGHQTFIRVTEVTQGLCGKSRPTHFQGVTTVVAMLFHIVMPHVAIFGEKDFQQLVTIRHMVRDLHMDVEIVGKPIVREADGLAMSSRNVNLRPEERKAALSLCRSLKRAKELIVQGERNADLIKAEMGKVLRTQPLVQIDYVQVCNAHTLKDVERIEGDVVIALAAYVGRVRLIDNLVFPGVEKTSGSK